MRTIKLKINAGGGLSPAHPEAKCGPDKLIYAIHGVPADVSVGDCTRHVERVCLLHAYDEPDGWEYEWADLAGLRQGAIINRYVKPS